MLIGTLIYLCCMFSNEGYSSNIKSLVMKRHFANVFAFAFLNLFTFISYLAVVFAGGIEESHHLSENWILKTL